MGFDETLADLRGPSAEDSRLASLLEAVVAVSSDLDLATTLHRIVVAACDLVDARYGALGVLGPDGERLVEFVTQGVTTDDRAAIGHPPLGKGLLGLIIHDAHPQRVADIASHPASVGFPDNHPVMSSFIGAPVRIRDQVFGNLYLTDKTGVAGSSEFTQDDEHILVALASAAGVAIENARLYDRAQAEQVWGEILREATGELLEAHPESEVLARVAERIRLAAGAVSVLIAVVDGPSLVVSAGSGDDVPPAGTAVGDDGWREVLRRGSPRHPDVDTPVLLAPMSLGSSPAGLIVVQWPTASATTAADAIAQLSDSLGVALAASATQREQARMQVFQDRDRIARDMHDHVIQRLFATGLTLHSAGRRTPDADVRHQLDGAVDELDAAIKDIRSTIYALRHPPDGRFLAGEISSVCEAAVVTLGFAPDLTIRGRVADIPEPVAADVIAVIREALSNVARHAGAHGAEVVVDAGPESVTVQIRDDGLGMPTPVRRSGLANMSRRAAAHGGAMSLASADPHGTVLIWTAGL